VMWIAHPVNWTDVTGAEAFGRLRQSLAQRGITLHLVGIKLPVEQLLRAAGHLDDAQGLRTYRTESEALQALPMLEDPRAGQSQRASASRGT